MILQTAINCNTPNCHCHIVLALIMFSLQEYKPIWKSRFTHTSLPHPFFFSFFFSRKTRVQFWVERYLDLPEPHLCELNDEGVVVGAVNIQAQVCLEQLHTALPQAHLALLTRQQVSNPRHLRIAEQHNEAWKCLKQGKDQFCYM